MTATANQMSASLVADPSEGADGSAAVAPPTAPFARVIDASRPQSRNGLFFVHSATTPGCWWRVDFVPGESLTCSCPRGQAITRGDIRNSKGCSHMRAVCDRMAAEAEAVAS